MPSPDLTAGWFDGDGEAVDPVAAERAETLTAAIVAIGAPPPRIYPTLDGGLQAEWTIGDWEASVTIEPGGGLYVIAVNVASGVAKEATLASDDPAGVLRLITPGRY